MHAHRRGAAIVALSAACLFNLQAAEAGARSISDLRVTLGDWELVPVLDESRVISFVAINLDYASAGQNLTEIWFQRVRDDDWSSFSWAAGDRNGAIAHVKQSLELPDSTDEDWNVSGITGEIQSADAVSPEMIGIGVFKSDPFSTITESMIEPELLLDPLVTAGWPAANLSLQLSDCGSSVALTTLAATIEADLATYAGGAILAGFDVHATNCDRWKSVSVSLDDDGSWAMPDLAGYFEALHGEPLATQSLESDTRVSGVQTLVVDLADGVGAVLTTVVVHLLDRTAPDVQLDLHANQAVRVGPMGLSYYRAPLEIEPTVVASDAIDAQPQVNVDIGGCTEGGTIILEAGYHRIVATSVDEAGNTSVSTRVIEVRDRDHHEAHAILTSYSATAGGAGETDVSATIHLAGLDFDTATVNMATVSAWLVDANGRWLHDRPIPIQDGIVNGTFDHAAAAIEFEECRWIIGLSGSVSLEGEPVGIHITGSGRHGQPDEYDLLGFASLDLGDPTAFFADLGIAEDCGSPPPPPPAPACTWKSLFLPDDPDTIWEFDWEGLCTIGYSLRGAASADDIWGKAVAKDHCYIIPHDSSHSGGVASGGTFKVFLEPATCCQDCSISVVARPKFKAKAEVNPPASAVAGGQISVATPCGDAAAVGGVAVGDFDSGTVDVPLPGIGDLPIPVGEGDQSGTQIFQGNSSCTHGACSIDISIATSAYWAVNAHASILNWHAEALSEIFAAELGISVTPTAHGDCEVSNNGREFAPPDLPCAEPPHP